MCAFSSDLRITSFVEPLNSNSEEPSSQCAIWKCSEKKKKIIDKNVKEEGS